MTIKSYTPAELSALEKANIPDAGTSAAKFKALEINRIFREKGTGGSVPQITPETVRDGERKE